MLSKIKDKGYVASLPKFRQKEKFENKYLD